MFVPTVPGHDPLSATICGFLLWAGLSLGLLLLWRRLFHRTAKGDLVFWSCAVIVGAILTFTHLTKRPNNGVSGRRTGPLGLRLAVRRG